MGAFTTHPKLAPIYSLGAAVSPRELRQTASFHVPTMEESYRSLHQNGDLQSHLQQHPTSTGDTMVY